MLLEIGLGDAYGACFEFRRRDQGWPNDLSGYTTNPAYPEIGGGRYTDDCQQSIAVAETLLRGDCSPSAFADAFVGCFRRDPRKGYSRRNQAFIESCADGGDFLTRIMPGSDRSGACMRACAIGLLGSEAEVLRIAEAQARVTHATPGGVLSAQSVALIVHGLRYRRCERSDLPGYLAHWIPDAREVWGTPWKGEVGSGGIECASAALWALVRHDSMSDMLWSCIEYEGDVDTVAAVAMGAASCATDLACDIPEALLHDLEDGPYGREFLASTDARLEEFARACGAPARESGKPGTYAQARTQD